MGLINWLFGGTASTATSVTLEQVLSSGSCYSDDKIIALFAGRPSLTMADVAELDIPVIDRIWAAVRLDLFTANELWELSCRFVAHVLEGERADGREADPRSWAVIDARRQRIGGQLDDAGLAAALVDATQAQRGRGRLPGSAAALAVSLVEPRAAVDGAWQVVLGTLAAVKPRQRAGELEYQLAELRRLAAEGI